MTIAVLPGDGIGPEVIAQAVRILRALDRHGVRLDLAEPGARLVGTEEIGAAVAAAI